MNNIKTRDVNVILIYCETVYSCVPGIIKRNNYSAEMYITGHSIVSP